MAEPIPYLCPVCELPMKSFEPLLTVIPNGLIQTTYPCDKCDEYFVRTTPDL